MNERLSRAVRNESGFTLLELLVVILIIGILAAIAIPAFLGQREKSKNASAKQDVKRVAQMVEECRLEKTTYADCDEQSELNNAPGINWGTGAGQSGVYTSMTSANGYAAYAISEAKSGSGNRVYGWVKNADGTVTKMCVDTSLAPINNGDCKSGSW